MEDARAWWERRRFSRGVDVPYPMGSYRDAWAAYPVLARQYHPDLNAGIALSQIPPAADVLLCWQCDAGHVFVATPQEQRMRPTPDRRRSAWCPECSAAAVPRAPRPAGTVRRPSRASRSAGVCNRTPLLPPGRAFRSACAPRPSSRVEAELRARLLGRLAVDVEPNAVRTSRPFFDHLEVWPDLVLAEFAVAIEWDSVGRTSSEHVGRRERADRRKDRLLRSAGWEVVRLRSAHLAPLGPRDLAVAGPSTRTIDRLIETLRDIRGPLIVDAYLR